MAWEDAFKIITAMIASIGAGGAIVFALSTWLGKLWAQRILENEKHQLASELEKTKRETMNEAKFAGTRYYARLEDRLLTDARKVNNWCDKEYAVKYLEETLRTYLGEDFSIVIEFESLSWGHVIDLYVGWCNEEDF